MSMPSIRNGGLQHHDVGVEGEDVADAELAVDHQPPAEEQHEGQAELGQVLHQRREAGAEVGVLDVGPLQPVGGPGQRAQLLRARRRTT